MRIDREKGQKVKKGVKIAGQTMISRFKTVLLKSQGKEEYEAHLFGSGRKNLERWNI